MARNKLTEDASKIADLIYKKSSEKTNKEIAEKIGIDPSNLGRFQSNYLEMVCAYLDEIGLSVHVKNESRLRASDCFRPVHKRHRKDRTFVDHQVRLGFRLASFQVNVVRKSARNHRPP